MTISGLAIDHVQIVMPPGGEDKARQFFGKLLGLQEIPKPDDMAKGGGCWFGIGTQQLHCGVEADFTPALKAHVALAAENLDNLRVKLENAGYQTQEDTVIKGRERFFTHDPFGNRIEFMDKAYQ